MGAREGHDAAQSAGDKAPVFDADAWSRYLTDELQQPVAVRFGRVRRLGDGSHLTDLPLSRARRGT